MSNLWDKVFGAIDDVVNGIVDRFEPKPVPKPAPLTPTPKKKEQEFMRGDILCQKCSADLGYGWDAMRHERKLVGGYKAVVCVECVNLWHEHVMAGAANGAYERLRKLDQEIAITQNCFVTTGGDAVGDALSALQPLYDRREAVQEELYAAGKAWAADKLPVTTGTVSNP